MILYSLYRVNSSILQLAHEVEVEMSCEYYSTRYGSKVYWYIILRAATGSSTCNPIPERNRRKKGAYTINK